MPSTYGGKAETKNRSKGGTRDVLVILALERKMLRYTLFLFKLIWFVIVLDNIMDYLKHFYSSRKARNR